MQRLMLKKGKPEKDDAIEIAIRKVGDDLDRYDLDSMAAKHAPLDEEGEPDGDEGMGTSAEDCEDCKNGTCENPEHLSEEDLRALEEGGHDHRV